MKRLGLEDCVTIELRDDTTVEVPCDKISSIGMQEHIRLDHIGDTVKRLERNGFEIHDVEGGREHDQRTCRLWHDRLLANNEAAVAEIGEPKTHLWLAYLGACSIAFVRNTVGIVQTVATKKQRGASGMPPTRAYLYRR